MPRPFTDREREQIRAALLAAGRDAAARGGLRRTPVEALCRAAGISKGAFYQFFDTKEALLLALLGETEAQTRRELLALATSGPPAERFAATLNALFGILARHPLLATLGDAEEFAWLERALPPGFLAMARADDDAFAQALVDALDRGGALRRRPDPAAFAGLSGAALALASHPALLGPSRDATVAMLVSALVDAYATRA